MTKKSLMNYKITMVLLMVLLTGCISTGPGPNQKVVDTINEIDNSSSYNIEYKSGSDIINITRNEDSTSGSYKRNGFVSKIYRTQDTSYYKIEHNNQTVKFQTDSIYKVEDGIENKLIYGIYNSKNIKIEDSLPDEVEGSNMVLVTDNNLIKEGKSKNGRLDINYQSSVDTTNKRGYESNIEQSLKKGVNFEISKYGLDERTIEKQNFYSDDTSMYLLKPGRLPISMERVVPQVGNSMNITTDGGPVYIIQSTEDSLRYTRIGS
jgi:hypothetical protein